MKLYWKVKVNGKWTFRAAKIHDVEQQHGGYMVYVFVEDGDIIDGQMP